MYNSYSSLQFFFVKERESWEEYVKCSLAPYAQGVQLAAALHLFIYLHII